MKPVSYLEVSRDALRRNGERVAEFVGVPVIGVVKCGGYGVSVEEAARAWQAAGAVMFAVSLPREALALRQAGFTEDILLLSPVAEADTLNELLEMGVILTVTGFESARFYSLHGETCPIRVHVAIDTGLGRFGIHWQDRAQLDAVYSMPGFLFEGIFSHFSSAFEPKYRQTKLQLERFTAVTSYLAEKGCPVGLRHIANSAAALRFPETRLDAVRIGSALVGRAGALSPLKLEEAAVFRAQVLDRRTLRRGDTTGYAAVCRVRRSVTVAAVAIGTENGFGRIKPPEGLPLRNFLGWLLGLLRRYLDPPAVYYGGRRLRLVGRIGNQVTLFDAGGLDLRPGDYVEARADLLTPGQERVFV